MAEYKSIHKGEEIDESVKRALNLTESIGFSYDKIMSQKAVTEQLQNKVDKTENKGLSSNDFTDELKDKLTNINKTYLISIDKVWKKISDDTYTQLIPVSGIKEKDTALVSIEPSKDAALADLELVSWSKISRILINNGSITVYCENGIPEVPVKIRIKT